MKTNLLLALALCLAALLMACTPVAELYRGKPVDAPDIVWLKPAGTDAGNWQTFDLSIDYQYAQDGTSLDVSGQGRLGQHYQLIYDGVRFLTVYLFLLDGDGRVLETAELPVFLWNTEDTFDFKRRLNVTDLVKGLSFGYRGQAYELQDTSYFDHLP